MTHTHNEEIQFNTQRESEFRISLKELKSGTPISTCRDFHQRLDNGVATALSTAGESIACSEGCWYCCYFKVDVKAEEVFGIINYIRKSFTPERLGQLRSEISRNAKKMRSLSHAEQLAENIKCPFLLDNKCSIYKVRPEKCRTYHAKDVEGCKKSFEEPTNLEIPMSFSKPVELSNQAHSNGHQAALFESGYDTTPYELNIAFDYALTDVKYKKRFGKKKKAFPQSYRRD